MKNVMKSMMLAAMLFFVMPGIVGKFESQYSKVCTVVDTVGDKVYVQDVGGNIWCFIGNNFNRNERVKVIMNNNHTGKINDDKVIKAKKL